MSGDLVTIATYESSVQANLARGRLEAEGIEALLLDENVHRMFGGVYGRVRLAVAPEDVEEAEAILGLGEHAGSAQESVDFEREAETARADDAEIHPQSNAGLLVLGVLVLVVILGVFGLGRCL